MRVLFGSNRFGAMAVLTMGAALSGCANVDWDTSQWFVKPVDMFGHSAGYSYSELQEAKQDRPITASDLVDAKGACPPAPAPAPLQPQSAPGGPGAMPVAAPDGASPLGEGVSLGMSECDVVYRAGQPSAVQLGQNPNGDRTTVLTFPSGPRSGIYRFERGRLMEMDRVAEPAPVATTKKPAKNKKTAKSNNAA